MNSRMVCLAATTCLFMTALSLPVSADTIVYDTISSNYLPPGGGSGNWWGYNPPFNETDVVGVQFTATLTGTISALETSMYSNPGVPGSWSGGTVQLGIYADNAGDVGSLVETLPLTINANPDLFATASYNSGAILNAGNSYWIVTPTSSLLTNWDDMETTTSETSNWFYTATTGTAGSLAISKYSPIYYDNSASLHGLQVTMAPVPLPASAWLMLSGVMGVGVIARRRRAT